MYIEKMMWDDVADFYDEKIKLEGDSPARTLPMEEVLEKLVGHPDIVYNKEDNYLSRIR